MTSIRSVLYLSGLAFAGGLGIRHFQAPAPEPVDEVLAFIHDPAVLRELGLDPELDPYAVDEPQDETVAAIPFVVIGDETIAERETRLAAERWAQRLETARLVNATTAARPEPGVDFEVRMPNFQPASTATPPIEEKDIRNPDSIYEQSRHYKKYGNFAGKLKKRNRGRVTVSLRR